MSLSRFEYHSPKTVAKAISMQEEEGKFLAGGTALLRSLKERIIHPRLLIDLNGLSPLKGIKQKREKGLRIGALVTLTQLKENQLVQKYLPDLGDIVSLIGAPQLQNMGTLGGNLCLDTRCYYYNQPAFLKKRWRPCFKMGGGVCHVVKSGDMCYAVYSGDMAAPLMALGAKVTIAGPNFRKELELEKFFSGSGISPNILKYNEILTEVVIPLPPQYSGLSCQKLRLRDSMDFPLLGIALFLHVNGRDGRCQDVRLVLSAVGPLPLPIEEAAEIMRGKTVTPKLIREVSEAVHKRTHPMDNTASSPKYRREMVGVLTQKAVHEALHRAKISCH
jgi:4-hydroxybenzoyl-CoA reductase subunit beta